MFGIFQNTPTLLGPVMFISTCTYIQGRKIQNSNTIFSKWMLPKLLFVPSKIPQKKNINSRRSHMKSRNGLQCNLVMTKSCTKDFRRIRCIVLKAEPLCIPFRAPVVYENKLKLRACSMDFDKHTGIFM